jgi:hypothetical protein
MFSGVDRTVLPRSSAPLPQPGLLRAFARGLSRDFQTFPMPVTLLRAGRRARLVVAPGCSADLCNSRSFAVHMAEQGRGDPLLYLSHRYFLSRDFTPRARILAAAAHYRHEDTALCDEYFRAVYLNGGLRLWRAGTGDAGYDIVLHTGRDVCREGGLSLVFRAKGESIGILSFSFLPSRILDPRGTAGLPPLVSFVTRKHLTQDRAYQPDFHRAFHRATVAQMLISAFSGLLQAKQVDVAVGIGGRMHPSNTPDRTEQFERAYDLSWQALGAKPLGQHHLLHFPLPHKPLDEMDAARRKRVRQRRAVQHDIETSAAAIYASMLQRGTGI